MYGQTEILHQTWKVVATVVDDGGFEQIIGDKVLELLVFR